MSDKYHDTVAASRVITNDQEVADAVKKIIDEHLQENMNPEVWKKCFNYIDLTTLNTTDSPVSVSNFTERVNAFDEEHPELPNVAAICVFPNFTSVVRTVLEVSKVEVACVSGCFPTAQSFLETKVSETKLAVLDGADEVDIVFNVGNYLDGDWEAVCDEISEQKDACGDAARLKVILETGALKTAENIRAASVLSLYSGADFLKTSTGKVYAGASLEAAYVMCQCLKEYYEKTGNMVGFKASGGISTTEDAVKYYTIVKEVLGDKWLDKEWFRLGASRLANSLLTDILGEETKFF
ncbi:MAG: deoxyribose-phosphate aldolase [Bacteroidales bacterium]|nr:deoxyribose-phosphate aldolase [Bacteroidales bacterium]